MFLWHMAVFEAALSGPYNLGANDLSLVEIELCTGLLDLCPFEPWRFPGPMSRLWSNEDLVVLTCADLPVDAEVTDESRWGLFVGGRTRDALEQLDGIGVAWDFDSRAGPRLRPSISAQEPAQESRSGGKVFRHGSPGRFPVARRYGGDDLGVLGFGMCDVAFDQRDRVQETVDAHAGLSHSRCKRR